MPDDKVFEKQPPQNLPAEKSIIGALMMRPEWVGDVPLEQSDFYSPWNGRAFTRLCKLAADGVPIDPISMAGSNKEASQTLVEYVADAIPSKANLLHHAAIVREMARRRVLIADCRKLELTAYDLETELDTLSKQLAHTLERLAGGDRYGSIKNMGNAMVDTMAMIDHATTGGGAGILTDWYELDSQMGGLFESDLVIIGGRPSQGKTSFAMNLVEHWTLDAQPPVPVMMFTLEMSMEQLLANTLARRAGIPPWLVRKGQLNDRDMAMLSEQAEKMSPKPLILADTPSLNADELKAKVRAAHAKYGLRAVFVDYLQLMEFPRQKGELETQAIGNATRSLKLLARELNVVIVLLSQLRRLGENENVKVPRMSDLRSSGAIEQDADVVLLLHRPEYYKAGDRPGEVDIIVEKQRNGPTGTVTLKFDKQLMRFRGMA
jgi:replicative DNA helicase